METSVKVTLSPTEPPKVEFKGDWCRKDIDIAYRQMMRSLLQHTKTMRELRSKENSQ